MKTCGRCRRPKPLVDFHVDRDSPDGRQHWCKVCANAHRKAKYHSDLDASRRRSREHQASLRADPVKNEALKEAQRRRYHAGVNAKQKAARERFRRLHFFRWRAQLWRRRWKVDITHLDLIRLWRAQGGRCALSGRRLGADAHLDHIIPVADGGPHDASNLRWLDPFVNVARGRLSDEDFIQLCRDIVAHTKEVAP